jgi:hypothetical protein
MYWHNAYAYVFMYGYKDGTFDTNLVLYAIFLAKAYYANSQVDSIQSCPEYCALKTGSHSITRKFSVQLF